MRMKNKLWILGVLALLGITSCYDDKGNYSYRDLESVLPIEIKGLPNDTTFMLFSDVELVPEIEGMENEADFQFTWYTYQLYVSGFVPQRDTLATTKNLSFKMEYPAGNQYQLIFEAKEKKTGIFVQKKMRMSVTSEYSEGWFILEDENGRTDMDFIRVDGTVQENLLTEVLGERMPGEAVKLVYMSNKYTDEEVAEDGSITILESQRALHILTTQDMKTLNPGNLSVFKNFDEEFYNVPKTAAPQNMDASGGDMLLINAGQLHSLYGMSANVGKFGVGKTGPGDLMSDMLFHAYSYTYAMLFSRETKSFVMGGASSESDKLQEFLPEANGGTVGVSTSNMNKELVCMLQRNRGNSVTKGWALMRGIDDPEKFYIADISFSGQAYPLVDFDEISSERAICHADVYGTHQYNSIYFAKGNVLSYYQKNASDLESVEELFYEFSPGETISFMQQASISVWDEEAESEVNRSFLVVLTNNTTGWKLYRCPLEGNGLSPALESGAAPVVIAEGKGHARFALQMQ